MGQIQNPQNLTPGYDDEGIIPTLQLQSLLDDLEEAVKNLIANPASESLVLYGKEQLRQIQVLSYDLSYDLQHLSNIFSHHLHTFLEGDLEEAEVLFKLIREMRQSI